jgi:hypothetical protein
MQALVRYANERVDSGLARLVAAQDADGLWRDYGLIPGPSEGWSTSWIGWHLAQFSPRPASGAALRRAAGALIRIRGPGGWGYNRSTGADADSTAWALRLMRHVGVRCGRAEETRLAQYVDGEGRAHTFEDTQHGTWSDAHDDVTPIVGLALLACDSRSEALGRLRIAVRNAQRADGLWTSFWWASDAYATFWSVYFLRRTGCLPIGCSERIWELLSSMPATRGCGLEIALWLLLALESRHPDPSLGERLVARLLEGGIDERWRGSPLLLVPPRFEGDMASPHGPHADERGLMTTAVACWALARWSERSGPQLDLAAANPRRMRLVVAS